MKIEASKEVPQRDIFNRGVHLEHVTANKWLLTGETKSATIERDLTTDLPSWLIKCSNGDDQKRTSAQSALAVAYEYATS